MRESSHDMEAPADPLRSAGYQRRLIFNSYRRTWVFALVMVGAIVARRLSGAPFGLLDWIPIGLLALPLVAGMVAPTPKRMHIGMVMAMERGKWKDVASLAEMLEQSLEPDVPVSLRFEFCLLKACALARTQGLEAGLAALQPMESNVDEAAYVVGLGRINAFANQHEKALRCYEQAIDLDPEHAAAWVYQAESLVSLGQFEDAGVVIDHVESLPLTDELNVRRIGLLGAALIEDGRAGEALELLELGLITANELAARRRDLSMARPFIQGVLAWALAEVGDSERATALLEEARPLLEDTGGDWLLAQAGGNHGPV